MEYFKDSEIAEVVLVLSNNNEAYVLHRADNFEIPTHVFNRETFYNSSEILEVLQKLQVDLLVLAGFLWLVPSYLLEHYPNRILNIHPSLLPKFGGKGMYGDRVHQSVLDAKEKESGITIHYINERFDEGEIIYQGRFKIEEGDTLDMVRFKGQQLEHQHYPRIIESIVKKISE